MWGKHFIQVRDTVQVPVQDTIQVSNNRLHDAAVQLVVHLALTAKFPSSYGEAIPSSFLMQSFPVNDCVVHL